MNCGVFIKKTIEEENVTVYLHFIGEYAVRQVEIYLDHVIKLSFDNPIVGNSFLYDQKISDIEWFISDFISESEFNKVWDYY